MTNRDFYNGIINYLEHSFTEGLDDDFNVADYSAKARELIAALDARNEKRKSADSKAKKETSSRREAVLAFLRENEGVHSRDEIARLCDITEGQATSACTALVKEGLVTKSEIKIDKAKKVVYAFSAEKIDG